MATDDRAAQRAFDQEVAELLAPTWERRRADIEEVATPVRAWLLDALAPGPGDTVLELAAGVGDTGYEAATRIGPDGRLLSTDSSPAMLDSARRRASELGMTNVEHRVVDAEDIDLDDASVDGVLCRFGYMLMPDPAAALAETRRVLRRGGRLALAVWGPPEQNPFFTTIGMAMVGAGHVPPPDPSGPGIFALADSHRTTSLLEGAGFREVRTEAVPSHFHVPDADAYVQMIADTAGGLGLAVQRLGAGDRAAVTDQCAAALEQFRTDGGYHIPNVTLCAAAS